MATAQAVAVVVGVLEVALTVAAAVGLLEVAAEASAVAVAEAMSMAGATGRVWDRD